jgi:nitrogen regulatory protein P-II 1
VRLELVCEDAAVERAIQLIGLHARTGQAIAGWVYVSPVERAIPINGKATTEEYGS